MRNDDGIYISSKYKIPLHYPDGGNDFCFKVEEKSFWFNHRNEIIEAAIKRIPFNGNFADIGGGNGYQIVHLKDKFPRKEFYLVEPNYPGCLNAVARGLENVYCMTYNEFPFNEKKIGGLGLFDVIEHIQEDEVFLRELQKATSTDTVLYITTPAFKNLWSDVDEFSGHFRRYTRKLIEDTLKNSGWTPVFTSYFFGFLPPLVWTFRCLPYKIKGKRTAKTVKKAEQSHHRGTFYEQVLMKIHRHEPKTILRNPIRYGSSILAIAINQ